MPDGHAMTEGLGRTSQHSMGTTLSRLFFISYTHVDHLRAAFIARQLERMGHQVLIQARDFAAGGNFVADMHAGLSQADHVIAVLSEDYLTSQYCLAEWTAAFARDPDGSNHHLIPIRVRECRPQGLLGPRTYIDLVPLGPQQAAKLLRRKIGEAIAASRASLAGTSYVTNIAGRRPPLIGRDALLEQVASKVQEGRPLALTGLAGIGKTALASELCRRATHHVTWLVNAGDAVAARASLRELALRLRLGDLDRDPEQMYDELGRWLGGGDDWLLLLDSLDDPSLLEALPIPLDRGTVLITSRSAIWGPGVGVVEVPPLEPDASARLLSDEAELAPETSVQLGRLLGGLPIALLLAAGYLRATGTPGADLVARLQAEGDAVTEAMLLSGPGHEPVGPLWRIALEEMRDRGSAGWQLLSVLAFMAPLPVPRAVLGSTAEDLQPLLPGTGPMWVRLDQAVAELRSRSLVTIDPAGSVVVHPLVQSAARVVLSSDERRSAAGLACSLMYRTLPFDPDVTDSPTFDILGPHALVSAHHLATLDSDAVDPPFVLQRLGGYLLAIDAIPQALEVLRFARSVADGASTPEMSNRPFLLSRLASAESQMGNVDEAILIAQEALGLWRGVYGPDHSGVGNEISNLAMMYHAKGDSSRAKELIVEAFQFHEERLGPYHPTTAIDLSNMALIEAKAGDLADAEGHLRQALAVHEKTTGPSSPTIATDLSNLGEVLAREGQVDQAVETLQRAESMVEDLYGQTHPRIEALRERLTELARRGA